MDKAWLVTDFTFACREDGLVRLALTARDGPEEADRETVFLLPAPVAAALLTSLAEARATMLRSPDSAAKLSS